MSGMDTTGVENALAVLKKMGRESNKNVFLISHKEELQGRVNNVLYVVKEGGFTSYSNDIEILDEDSDVYRFKVKTWISQPKNVQTRQIYEQRND